MTKAQVFLAELQQEAIATRQLLALVPLDQADWKPHPKSMPLVNLASHVAEIPGWFHETLVQDVLDFETVAYKPFVPTSSEELVAHLEHNLQRAAEILSSFPDEKMKDNWTMRSGETIYFTLPKEQVARTWCLNHWYHHRAQLGVYLRLLDIPLPGTYGPSADQA